MEKQITQEWVVKDSLGCKIEPYTFERVASWWSSDGRIPESGSGSVLEYFRNDGGRFCEVVDAI